MTRAKWLLAVVMASMLIILSGCQSVGGLDINKVQVDSLTVKSSESKQTFSLEIVPSDEQISEEDKEIIDLLNSFSLSVDHVKVQDSSTASAEGTLSLDGKDVPFHVSIDKEDLIFWVQGAKQPISIPIDTLSSEYDLDLAELKPSPEESLKLITDVGKFFFKNAPNPESISLSTVTEKVYGEEVSLQKLHVDIRGDEVVGLAKSFLTSVAKDKEGVNELISTLYDIFYPVYQSGLNTYGEEYLEEELPSFGTWDSVIEDKEATVIYLTNQLQKALNDLLVDYDKDVQEVFEEEPLLDELLSKDTVLAMDIMFDKKLQVRKRNVDITIAIPSTEMEEVPVKQIKIHFKSEFWNVNEPVTINKVDTSKGAFLVDMFALDVITPGSILRNFDTQSEPYRFLKEDMSITHKYFILDTVVDEDDEYFEYYYDYPLPIDVNNTRMVPIRYVAEQLDAQLKWDNSLKQATITDDLTGSIIVLKDGSNQALVDGKKVKLSEPVMYYDGAYYVPLRFLPKALGATVEWDNDSKSILIERQ